MLSTINLNSEITESETSLCNEVINYIETFYDIVKQDEKCLFLLLRLKWLSYSKKPFLYLEKTKLSFEANMWSDIYNTINLIFNIMPDNNNALLWYIKSVTSFHLNLRSIYIECFRKVSHLYYPFSKRIIINYIASNTDGTPRKFTGSLQLPLSENKAKVYINELGLTVPYFNPNFLKVRHTREEYYDNIELGFNFLGIQITKIPSSGGNK
jgi:hypothetical protein